MLVQEYAAAYVEEKHTIRQNGNFVGWLFLSMIAVQTVVKTLVGLGAFSGLVSLLGTHEGVMVLNMILYVVQLAVPCVAVAMIAGRRQTPFPTKRVRGGIWFVGLFGGMALAIVANLVSGWLMEWLTTFGIPEPDLPETVLPTYSSLAVNLLSTAVLPAFIEEMIFRGYMLGTLRRHGDGFAVVVTAVFFGVFHGNVLQMPFAVILGLALGYLTVITDCIWPAVLLHFSNNAMAVLLSFFEQRFPDNTTEINGITFLVVAMIGTIVLTVLLHGRETIRPIGNRYSTLRMSEQVWTLLSSPVLVVAEVLMILTLVQSMRGAA